MSKVLICLNLPIKISCTATTPIHRRRTFQELFDAHAFFIVTALFASAVSFVTVHLVFRVSESTN